MRKSALLVGGLVAAALVVGTGTGAVAKTLLTGADIKDGSITGADIHNGTVGYGDLTDYAKTTLRGAKGAQGDKGATGARGPAGTNGTNGTDGVDGKDGVFGAYYAVAFYDVGNTNAGAIATVACSNVTDVAISGGTQVTGLDAGANSRNTPVSSSFPGRMDWSTNTPKADRLDGWIVQFGGNAGATSDVAPEKVKVWALCVPGATIPVVQTYTQSS